MQNLFLNFFYSNTYFLPARVLLNVNQKLRRHAYLITEIASTTKNDNSDLGIDLPGSKEGNSMAERQVNSTVVASQ